MKKNINLQILYLVIFLTSFPFVMFGQQDSNDYQQFLGVWRKSDVSDKWVYRDMKIYESDGVVYVQMKTSDEGIKKAKAQFYNQTLHWSFVLNKNYGKWKLGAWQGGKYREKLIVGSNGSDGDCSGIYPNYNSNNNIANEEIEFINFKADIKDGDMELYWSLSSEYCNGNTPLFYQSSRWGLYDNYTNW